MAFGVVKGGMGVSMKKALAVFALCVVFIIIYFLQLNFFSWFTIAEVKPNLFIILALFIGLYTNEKLGAILSMIFGFIVDFAGSNLIGGAGLALGVVGFLRRISRKKLIER